MSKQNLIKICFVVATLMAAGTAYASSGITSSVTLGGGAFAPSQNVTINVAATDSSYAAYSGHLQGDKVFFSNNVDPKLYYGTKTKGTAITNTVAATDTAPSGWSSM
ncbi:hypothetical protein [Geobacter sp.]|uniref:hypothetical protein n=1 Tax=Geobacter sp. TaxID=46610 RepID=UPI0026092EF8|nr:hypothetical protein [Geobacter sp.]